MGSESSRPPDTGQHGPSRSVVVLGPLSRRINRFVLRIAGHRRSGPVARVVHRGRRSGRRFTTPVLGRPDGATFLIPLFFGTGADWVRNVLAAGQCDIEWHARTGRLTSPRICSAQAVATQVRTAFPAHERAFIRVSGVPAYLVGEIGPIPPAG